METPNTPTSIVEVFPDPLVMTLTSASNYYESKLNLTNLTNEYVVFKIYNNQRSVYSAKPSVSFIRPRDTTYVSIKRFKKEEVPSRIGKDKFLLQFYTINKIINDNDEAKEAIKTKIYNENTQQDITIAIILKREEDSELTYTYNESVLEDIGDDIFKGIKTYTELNENLRNQTNVINNNIKNLENTLEDIKKNKELLLGKEIAMKDTKKTNISKDNNFPKIILVCVILLGLVIGANLSKGYNRLFNQK